MFNKSIIAMAVAVGFAGTAAHAGQNTIKTYGWQKKVNYVINADTQTQTDQSGRSRYVVQLIDAPAALHAAERLDHAKRDTKFARIAATPQKAATKVSEALKTAELQTYRQTLARNQSSFKSAAGKLLGRSLTPKLNFDIAYNGMVLELTPTEAEQLLTVPQVVRVIKEVPSKLMTDIGPQHIGAGNIWDGSATGITAKGEGMIMGVMDTGINTDNRAFAATGDDGYTVTNPLGSGNFLGDCTSNASLCNDKLIGVYSYPEITDTYDGIRPASGEDYNGHGSHTASTSAGNVLLDVPVLMPSQGTQVGDGVASGTVLPRISGVALHANIISYQVCGLEGCSPSLTIASVEHAIEDGVDVLNYSIGPNGGVQGDPWSSPEILAFLSAREAGMVVAMAAGNDGPSAHTVGNVAPWGISVAASTHERIWSHELTGSGANGEVLQTVEGLGDVFTSQSVPNLLSVATEVVYAGDYQDRNGNSLALCDQAINFRDPVRTTLAGKVVVCDRGDIPLVDKVTNMYFAAGVIIRNTPDSNQNLVNARYSLPSMLIDQADGETLLTWMRATDTPKVSISAATAKYDSAGADILAGFSSRGPYRNVPELMVPHISAPGVDIYAAYADEKPFDPAFEAQPADFAFLSGTSMATPHVAGAAVLLSQLHPDWTPAELQSAMMLSANDVVLKEDGVTPATVFDAGSGALRIDQAAKVGLVMDVPIEDYKSADPAQGGDPTTINYPALFNSQCMTTCSWERTFRATRNGSWSVSTTGDVDGLRIKATPEMFEATEGQSITITFTANVASRVGENWSFMRVNLTPADSSPVLSMPLAIKPMLVSVPSVISSDYFWSEGELSLPGLRFRYPDDVLVTSTPLVKATSYQLEVAEDSTSGTPFDDVNDGTVVQFFDVTEGNADVRIIVGDSSAQDIDLFVGLDSDNDGKPSVVELTAACATEANIGEECRLNLGEGHYWLMINNYLGSGTAKDTVRIDLVNKSTGNALDTLTTVDNAGVQPYDEVSANMNWFGEMSEGIYYGEMNILDRDSASTTRALANTHVVINRVAPEVMVNVTANDISRGQMAKVTVTVPGNPTPEELTYTLTLATIADVAISHVSESTQQLSHSDKSMSITLAAGASSSTVDLDVAPLTATTGEFAVYWSLDSSKAGFSVQEGSFMLANSNEAPTLAVPAQLSADMGTQLTLNMLGEDSNDDQLTYTLVQLTGPAINIVHDGGSEALLTLPVVDADQVATFKVSVSDGEFTQSANVSLNVVHTTEESNGGGSLSWGAILLGLLGLRRKMQN